jgi:putative polyketide hydroxylase
VLRGEAGEALLDTYEAERRPIATMIVDTSLHNMKQRMRPDLDVSGLTPPVEPFAGMLGFCYSSTAVLREEQSSKVLSAPKTRLSRPDALASAHRMWRSRATAARTSPLWTCSGTAGCCSRHSAASRGVTRLRTSRPRSAWGSLATSKEPTSPANFRHGLDDGGGALVRPDGMVTWRTKDAVEDAASTLWNVLGRVLSR